MTEAAASGEGLIEAHRAALAHTGKYVDATPSMAWHQDTPCEGWDAAALMNHITGGNLWAAELMAGRTIDEVGDALDGDQVGEDPSATYQASAQQADGAFSRPGALADPAAVSYGPVPGEVYLGHRFIDVLIHGWDLAAATGQDRTLPPELVQVCQEVIEPQKDLLLPSGMFGIDHTAEVADDRQSQLLAMLGRDPQWSGA